jgi:hypothetical protein
MTDLSSATTNELVTELGARGSSGVISLTPKGAARQDVWWGDRVKCLGLISRLTHGINLEMNEHELCEDDEEDGEDIDESTNDISLEFPQLGQYL